MSFVLFTFGSCCHRHRHRYCCCCCYCHEYSILVCCHNILFSFPASVVTTSACGSISCLWLFFLVGFVRLCVSLAPLLRQWEWECESSVALIKVLILGLGHNKLNRLPEMWNNEFHASVVQSVVVNMLLNSFTYMIHVSVRDTHTRTHYAPPYSVALQKFSALLIVCLEIGHLDGVILIKSPLLEMDCLPLPQFAQLTRIDCQFKANNNKL